MCSRRDTIFSVVGLAAATATLAVARSLHPCAAGVGTHVQFGLPPCRFLALTGMPCPSCGLTTSFAFAAHVEFGSAFIASPFGLLLFLAVVLSIPAICIQLWSQVAWETIFRALDLSTIALWIVATYVSSWLCKLTTASALSPPLGI